MSQVLIQRISLLLNFKIIYPFWFLLKFLYFSLLIAEPSYWPHFVFLFKEFQNVFPCVKDIDNLTEPCLLSSSLVESAVVNLY